MARERMTYDVLIVGGGPGGLATAIRLRQLARAAGRELSVCVIEKGAEIGAHLLSGAVLDPRALSTLIPDWQAKGAPLSVPVTSDSFRFLTRRYAVRFPTPPQMHNAGNYVISLGQFGRWLAGQADALGVEIYPGFAAAEVLQDDTGRVIGVATGDMGVGKDGTRTDRFSPGVELVAKQTVFAEGCRGSLTQDLFSRFNLRDGVAPQTYGLGIKEVWEVDPAKHKPGTVIHTIGWPLDARTYGGSWLYHAENNLVSVGLVVGLDYANPTLSPFEEMQRFKLHPSVRSLLEGGRRVAYGARALSEGGVQSLPKLSFPGGVLVGDAAGFLNVARIKGTHTAMQSGIVAAEAIFAQLDDREVTGYRPALEQSWLWDELFRVRNVRPAFQFGLWGALALNALDTYVFRGRAPWTLTLPHPDHECLRPAKIVRPIVYPKPDGRLTFDRLSSVYLSSTTHAEDQPSHLVLRDPTLAVRHNLPVYDAPEQRYCPAGVYEIVHDEAGTPRLVINAQNCVHCKTCDIKDPLQNIVWRVPEGGGGPNYGAM